MKDQFIKLLDQYIDDIIQDTSLNYTCKSFIVDLSKLFRTGIINFFASVEKIKKNNK
jgi:hypothetical protein